MAYHETYDITPFIDCCLTNRLYINTYFAVDQVDSAVLEQLGLARKIKVANNTTTMIADAASKEDIDMRIAQLKKGVIEGDHICTT